jgi:crotonobetainyl-CoA:carnitine CoA-transferase CaiB-like acyl-CoA transferase
MRSAGLAVAPVLVVPRMYDDPQLVARGYYQELEHPRTGRRRYPGWPAQFSFLSQHHRRGAPTLGQHNREILTEDLGLTDAEVDALAHDGIIGDRMQPPA